jgi:DNA/RNA-binding domain of Phe-tRNA-synthetase-like protein
MLQITKKLKKAYSGGWIGGIFFKKAKVSETGEKSLIKTKGDLENRLRCKYRDFSRSDLILLEPIKSYITYYKQFKKTYHVLLQLESVILKGKSVPNVNPLVTMMFMAELRNLLLTAGHDLDSIALPIRVELSEGNERYRLLNGMEKELPAGDMMMADSEGIISSIIYGPDNRTQITENTTNVLYTVYAPPGIEGKLIQEHLNDINCFMRLVAPEAKMEEMAVYPL